MKPTTKPKGFTLIEVIITIAIIGILTAIAVPSYSEYIKRTHLNTAAQKAAHLQMLLDDYWEDNKTYISGNDDTDTILQTELGWHSGDNNITSKVEAGSKGIATSFIITVTHAKFVNEPVIIKHIQN